MVWIGLVFDGGWDEIEVLEAGSRGMERDGGWHDGASDMYGLDAN